MTLDPIKATDAVVGKYLSYLQTTFAFRDDELHAQLVNTLVEAGKFSKGPVLEVTPPYETGKSVHDLIKEGVLSAEFRQLGEKQFPIARSLYLHQEQSIRKLVVQRRNTVVSTGTGSGKTEAFLIPILNHLFRQKEEGKLGPGVRALLLYPMNALANDQLKRLRELLKLYPEVTFGSYTGETERDTLKAIDRFKKMNNGESPLVNELTSRDQMKRTPPHILLTNYAMLEYLLLRPEDNVFFDGEFSKDWKFIVVDEAHVYSGAKGIEMAMLLRRLKDRVVQSQAGRLQCIATSATLVGPGQDYSPIAEFGSGLFSEEFEWIHGDPQRQDVVIGQKKRLSPGTDGWGEPDSGLYIEWMNLLESKENPIGELSEVARQHSVPAEIARPEKGVSLHQFLFQVLSGDKRVIELQRVLEECPWYLEEIATKIFPGDTEARNLLVALVYLANKARQSEVDKPLLPARYHLFVRAIEGAYISFFPQRKLYLERRETVTVEGKSYQAFEAATCNHCNSLYLVGQRQREGISEYFRHQGGQYKDDRLPVEYYLCVDEQNGQLEDNEDDLVTESNLPAGERFLLCGVCSSIKGENQVTPACSCGSAYLIPLIQIRSKGNMVHRCSACGTRNNVGSVVWRFLLGGDAVTSVLGTALYQQIPTGDFTFQVSPEDDDDGWGMSSQLIEKKAKDDRKLLIFSDSRQDAAFFATYLGETFNQILRRRLIIYTLQHHGVKVQENQWRLPDLVNAVKRTLMDLNLFPDFSIQSLEDEAWRWVLAEFISPGRRNSLEDLGMLGFVPVLPGWSPPPPLKNQWGLDPDESRTLYMVLLDSFRKYNAVLYPDSVTPDDPIFWPKDREYYFKMNETVRSRIFSWCPAGRGLNTRVDYLSRVFGEEYSPEKCMQLLKDIWDKNLMVRSADWSDVFSHVSVDSHGIGSRIKPKYWLVKSGVTDPSIKWHQCNRCQRLTLHNIRGVCPTYRCSGSLRECDPGKDLGYNHYRDLYLNLKPMQMKVHEHTAQLSTEKAAEIQREFTDGLLNVLSCSTTFELGVDVGDLETVFMRNIPPSVANYIQRAGRAGRRTSSAAFVLTFAQRRSHDFSHYADPLKIISGQMKSPIIQITNQRIVIRHVFAVALAEFWRRNDTYSKRVEDFFFPEKGESGPELLQKFLNAKPEWLLSSLLRIVPEDMHEELGIHDWTWIGKLLDHDSGVLSLAAREVYADVAELEMIQAEYALDTKFTRANYIKYTLNTMKQKYLLTFCSQKNIIPKYGFPVDVVNMQIKHHGDEAKGLELDRDLRIALSEYAPDGKVVAGGKLWTSRYIKKLPDREPIRYSYTICDTCGYYWSDIAEKQVSTDLCLKCGESIGQNKGTFIVPEFGFIADKPGKPGLSRPEKTYTTRKFYKDSGLETASSYNLGGLAIELMTAHNGELAVINNAGKRGFQVCASCGYAEINDGNIKSHNRPLSSLPCGSKRGQRFSLGYEFKTDILQFRLPDFRTSRKGFWESVLYGFLEGASAALDIERQDIDGCLFAYSGNPHQQALVLFDDVPGGAGHVKRLAHLENFEAAINNMFEIASRCDCGGDDKNTSCYGCLRSYSNQYCHEVLNRGYVIEFAEKLLGWKSK